MFSPPTGAGRPATPAAAARPGAPAEAYLPAKADLRTVAIGQLMASFTAPRNCLPQSVHQG